VRLFRLFLYMLPPPPRSTLFPTRRSSDLVSFTPDLVTVIFRNPTTPASSPGISLDVIVVSPLNAGLFGPAQAPGATRFLVRFDRSEEHTSELQSLTNLVCRLLLQIKTHTA